MKIGNILQAFKIQAASKRRTNSTAPAAAAQATDKVSISPQAKSLQQLQADIQTAKTALEKIPDVRESRIREVSLKIQSGYYNSNEFKSELAGRLSGLFAKEFAASTNVPDDGAAARVTAAAASDGDDEGRLSEIRKRIGSGYYSSDSVKKNIAEKIMKDLGI